MILAVITAKLKLIVIIDYNILIARSPKLQYYVNYGDYDSFDYSHTTPVLPDHNHTLLQLVAS